MTLYQVLHELQIVLAVILGACPLCCQPVTPARVHRDFRNIRAMTTCPAGAPEPGKPGPGLPPGSKNRRPAVRHTVGKTTKKT